MSTPSEAGVTDIGPPFGLTYEVIEQLIPLFEISIVDIPLARSMALSAIEAYEPQTHADYVNVARTIALSITSLALLGQAASKDMPMPEKMRVIARANALNRTADQSERTMMQRRRQHQTTPPAEQPMRMDRLAKSSVRATGLHDASAPHDQTPSVGVPPTLDFADIGHNFTDAELDAVTAEAMRLFAACAPPNAGRQFPPPVPALNTPSVAPRPKLILSPATPPPQEPPTAVHRSAATSSSTPARQPGYKQELLRQSAMERVIQETAFPKPA